MGTLVRWAEQEYGGTVQVVYLTNWQLKRYAPDVPDMPDVLAYFSANEYAMEYEDKLGAISKPTLMMTGAYDRTCTPRASRERHAGIPGSETGQRGEIE